MKPREFDDLVRQKFEQNDFAYNSHNWDMLAEKLDGRAKKRSMIMWLWMPAAGMAASVALAIGVSSLLRFGVPETTGVQYAQTGKVATHTEVQAPLAMVPYTVHHTELNQPKSVRSARTAPAETPASSKMGIRLRNVAPGTGNDASGIAIVPGSSAKLKSVIAKKAKSQIAARQIMKTFRDEDDVVRKPLNLSIILSGGVCQGNRNSGYMAGATIRKMINDKVYVESDIALASSDNIQSTMYMDYSTVPATGTGGNGATAARPGSASASKTTSVETANIPPDKGIQGTTRIHDVAYNLYYAQVTPSIGYKIMKRMSIGMGPDFQKMLVDNRPATSDVDRGNLQVAPTFDVGFIGKTEYALTHRVKAAVAYRKGINSVINTSNKYIDRDYLQFQMRCTIFNR
jgi:hypothetical protein